jgi:hypothetical protein
LCPCPEGLGKAQKRDEAAKNEKHIFIRIKDIKTHFKNKDINDGIDAEKKKRIEKEP